MMVLHRLKHVIQISENKRVERDCETTTTEPPQNMPNALTKQ